MFSRNRTQRSSGSPGEVAGARDGHSDYGNAFVRSCRLSKCAVASSSLLVLW